MARELRPVGGAKLYIGGAMSLPDGDVTESSFSGVAWVRASKWTSVGEYGDTAAVITSQRVDQPRDIKGLGTVNAGQMVTIFADDPEDVGQLAFIAASKTKYNYPIKIEWDDAPPGGTPTTDYFIGVVPNARYVNGGPNTERTLSVAVDINTNIVRDPRAA